jgi:hypothetical protein
LSTANPGILHEKQVGLLLSDRLHQTTTLPNVKDVEISRLIAKSGNFFESELTFWKVLFKDLTKVGAPLFMLGVTDAKVIAPAKASACSSRDRGNRSVIA